MTAFDTAVCHWLNNASADRDVKLRLLRMVAGSLQLYHEIITAPRDAAAAATSDIVATLGPFINNGLRPKVTHAMHQLASDMEGDVLIPLDSPQSSEVPAITATRDLSVHPQQRRTSVTPKDSMSPERGLEGSKNVTFNAEFRPFSEEESGAPSPITPLFETAPADEMTEVEDRQRRRLTIRRGTRNAVSAASVDLKAARSTAIPTHSKPEEVRALLQRTLASHHLFDHLDEKELAQLVDAMELRVLRRNERVITAGDNNDSFYVVVTGSCARGVIRQRINIGESFGEVGLLYDSPSVDTVEAAVAATRVCALRREICKPFLAQVSENRREKYEGFLQRVKYFSCLNRVELLRLAEALREHKFQRKEALITYGSEGSWFYLILSGTVEVVGRDDHGNCVTVCQFSEGQCVGELEFLHHHRAVADVIAVTDVQTAKMGRRHFELLIGSAKEVLARQAATEEVYGYYRGLTRRE